jgi:hypothetical protein
MSTDTARQEQVSQLRVELDRLCSTPLGRCPACRRPVRFEEPYVRVNGRYVHAACARVGVYEEVPSAERTDANAA